jgi:hypothetical protein
MDALNTMRKVARTLAAIILALGSLRANAQGSIAGTVYDSLRTHAPLADATVVLVEKSRYATTDALGRFSFDSVPDGHYTIGFTHAVLDSLDVQGPIAAVDVAGAQRASVTLATPSSATLYARLCPGEHDPSTGMLVGRVRKADGQTPVAGAAVSTAWTEFTTIDGHTVSKQTRAATRTSAGGLYLLCNLPADVTLEVSTEFGPLTGGPTTLATQDRLFSRLDFALGPKAAASRADPSGNPFARGAQQLKAVTVEASAKAPSWMVVSGFDERRAHGLGAYITADEIAKHNFTDMAQVFRSLRGIKVDCNSVRRMDKRSADMPLQGVPCRDSVYMQGAANYTSNKCTPNFYLDGAPFPSGYSDLNASIPVGQIKGIEVYSNPGSMPAQFDLASSRGCGSIVIWTH